MSVRESNVLRGKSVEFIFRRLWYIYGGFLQLPSFFVTLTFCSLIQNQITVESARELAGALRVNQSLQRLK